MVLATTLAALLLASSVLAEETTIPLTRRKGWRDSNGAVNMTAYVQEVNHMAV